MSTGRWRITLVEDTEFGPSELPSAHHGRGHHVEELEDRGAAALIAAVELLGLRSEGPESFTVSPSNDPIAFLLDTVADAVSVWRGTSVLYRNRAAERMEASGRTLDRRSLRFRRGDADYILEIIHERS